MRHATNTETLSAKTATLSIQNTCCVESCYVTVAATYMPTSLVSLPQTPLLFKHTSWLSAAARWILAGQLPLCKLLPFNVAFLLALCISSCHTHWYSVSLSAVHAGIVSHYQPCLLVWCLNIGCACSCGV